MGARGVKREIYMEIPKGCRQGGSSHEYKDLIGQTAEDSTEVGLKVITLTSSVLHISEDLTGI